MHFLSEDTIVAPATPVGAGALTLLRLSGPEALSVADAVVRLRRGSLRACAGYSLRFGRVFRQDGSLLDEVMVSVFRAPHSYTGEDCVELSCHASSYIAEELIRRLSEAGARLAEPGEFTRRAYLNGKMDLAQAESVADVISSSTEAAHRVAMHQLRGGVSIELQQMRAELLEFSALLELELDFSEEDVEFADRRQLYTLLEGILAHIGRLTESFRLGNAVKRGVPVAIVGPANAGKSTLLNALVGDDRALVSELAGTTRDTIEERIHIGGIGFRLIDTAGIRESEDPVEKMGIDRTFRTLADADFVIFVLDASAAVSDLLNNLSPLLSKLDEPVQRPLIWLNKADLLSNSNINNIVTVVNNFVLSLDKQISVVFGSAKAQTDIDAIRSWLLEKEKKRISHAHSTLITNRRHYDALCAAAANLEQLSHGLATSLPTDLLAEELRLALTHLGTITGEITSSDTLHHIFQHHCIGK